MGLSIVIAVLSLVTSLILAVDDNNVYTDPMQGSLDSPHLLNESALNNKEGELQPDDIKQHHTESRSYDIGQNTKTEYFDHRYVNLEELRKDSNGQSQWCAVATLCKESSASICGFDDLFGMAKFNDFCHMFQANCYWNYNFTLAPCK